MVPPELLSTWGSGRQTDKELMVMFRLYTLCTFMSMKSINDNSSINVCSYFSQTPWHLLSLSLFSHEKDRNNQHKDCLHRSHCSFINHIRMNKAHVIWPQAISHNTSFPCLGSRGLVQWSLCYRLVQSQQQLPVIFTAGFTFPIVYLFIFLGKFDQTSVAS